MKTKLFWIFGLVMMFAAGPAFGGKAMQMWNCGMENDASEAQVEEAASKWLAAAKKVDGAEDMEAYILFPVAVNATGETDFIFVVTLPNFAAWGKFWDAYPSSEAAAMEEGHTFCPDSVVWESVKVK